MIILSSVSASILATLILIIFLLLVSNSIVNAQLVVMDETRTDPTEELDVKIYPTEPLPANGTVIVDITEADDIDIETIPPEGVTIIMTNTTIIVTNEDIEITEKQYKFYVLGIELNL